MNPDPDLRGKILSGQYEIQHRLGQGGMATVWLAFDRKLQRKVALKFSNDSTDPEAQQRFEQEIRSLAVLDIEGLVKIYDVNQHDGHTYFVQQYLSGGALEDHLQQRQSLQEVLQWLPRVAETLDRLHQRDFTHRDIKPGNILFDEDGLPKIADLGIAKSADAPALTGSDYFAPGTVRYMAPEWLDTEPSPASDQYALALTVYEALEGRLPFESKGSLMDVMRERRASRPTKPNHLAAAEADACWPALERALSRDPADRHASCSDFSRAFVISASRVGDREWRSEQPTEHQPRLSQNLLRGPPAPPERVSADGTRHDAPTTEPANEASSGAIRPARNAARATGSREDRPTPVVLQLLASLPVAAILYVSAHVLMHIVNSEFDSKLPAWPVLLPLLLLLASSGRIPRVFAAASLALLIAWFPATLLIEHVTIVGGPPSTLKNLLNALAWLVATTVPACLGVTYLLRALRHSRR